MKQKGVTLIELMVVVAVIAIISTIAYPSYTDHLKKSHRAQAKTNLVMMQLWAEEKLRTSSIADEIVSAAACPSCNIDTTRYTYRIVPDASAAYAITATIKSGGPQVGDECGTLTIKGNGAATGSKNNCW